MATSYFESPTEPTASPANGQYRGHFNGGNLEHGFISFSSTSTTVEVFTRFSKLICAVCTWQDAPSYNETLYCDLVVTTGAVTVSRIANDVNQEFHFPIDNGQFSANNLTATPLMVAQNAMTIVETELYEGTALTAAAGTPTFDMEKVGSANFFLSGKATSETGGTTTTWNAAAHASTAIADGDVIQVNTNSGDGGTGGDWVVSMSATKTGSSYTSALAFNYMFIGIY